MTYPSDKEMEYGLYAIGGIGVFAITVTYYETRSRVYTSVLLPLAKVAKDGMRRKRKKPNEQPGT